MQYLTGSGIKYKNTSNKNNKTVQTQATADNTIYVNFNERILEILNDIDKDKEKYNEQQNSNTNPPCAVPKPADF